MKLALLPATGLSVLLFSLVAIANSDGSIAKPNILLIVSDDQGYSDLGCIGIDFDDAWPHRFIADLDGLSAFVIGRRELLKNKLAAGRPKDLLDADILKSQNKSTAG